MFDIKIEMPRPKPGRALPRQGAEHSAVVGLARLIRQRRIRTARGPEGRAPQYKGGRKVVSPRYPEARGGEVSERSGARIFESSKAFHDAASAESGSGFVSGGMWDGLSLLVRSGTRSRLAFRGRSEGQDPNVKTYKSGKTKAKGKKQSNALKAGTLLQSQGYNVIEPEDREVEGLSWAIAEVIRQDMIAELPLSDPGSNYAISREANRILRAVQAHERSIGRAG